MEDWFKVRKYPHIGPPIERKDFPWVCNYVKTPDRIIKHSFYPLLFRQKTQRKFRREKYPDGSRSESRVAGKKIRPILYASHLDSNIYAYYAFILSKKYEEVLTRENISHCPTAYRRMKKKDGLGNCCSIDHAEEVFSFIKENEENRFFAITLDIKSFYDRLDHALLKISWRQVLNSKNLPEDHYKVFKQVTKYSYCNEKRIFDEFKSAIIIRRPSGSLRKKGVSKFDYLRSKNAVSFCSGEEFRSRIVGKNILLSNKEKFGIPQGSPISSVLANIYMIDFDKKVNDYCVSINALYRRYSDDIVLVCSEANKSALLEFIQECIKLKKLEIQPSKTQVYEFVRNSNTLECFKEEGGQFSAKYNFEYLGFEFDGEKTILKSSSLSKFYRTLKHSLKRADFYSRFTQLVENRGKVFRSRLYKRFSHLGMQRRRKYVRDKNDPSVFRKSEFYDWGNYLSYAHKASRIMSGNRIMPQLKKHWGILNSRINEIEKKNKPK